MKLLLLIPLFSFFSCLLILSKAQATTPQNIDYKEPANAVFNKEPGVVLSSSQRTDDSFPHTHKENNKEQNFHPTLKMDPGGYRSGINLKAGYGTGVLGIGSRGIRFGKVVAGMLEIETSLQSLTQKWTGFGFPIKWLVQAGGGVAFLGNSKYTPKEEEDIHWYRRTTDPYISAHTGLRLFDQIWIASLTVGLLHSKLTGTNPIIAVSFGQQLHSVLLEVNLALHSGVRPYALISIGIPLVSY